MKRKLCTIIVCSTLFTTLVGLTVGCDKNKPNNSNVSGTNTVAIASAPAADASPVGHWETEILADAGRRFGITLDLAKNAKSEWIASMGAPSENMTGLVVKDLAVNGKSVKFIAVELMMAPFDLTLGPDGTMSGTMRSQPVRFKRTGEANVALIPNSPAVSRELEGDWEGSLGSPGNGFRLIFHFKNQPDNTVAATIDSNNNLGMPLNDVKQTGQKVEFGIKIGGGSFQGTMNKEGTELAGKLMHDGNGVPLTLRKK